MKNGIKVKKKKKVKIKEVWHIDSAEFFSESICQPLKFSASALRDSAQERTEKQVTAQTAQR